jgi:hypothetical protein
MWKSYDKAHSFSELNSYLFANICHEILEIDLQFFLYSDVIRENLFIEESKKILDNITTYNHNYNQVISEKNLDIPPVQNNHVPFWYNCGCGGKITLFFDSLTVFNGICPVCKKNYHFDFGDNFKNLPDYFDKMDFTAVSRNIIMADGLGDTVFLSGTGGSTRYGCISDKISLELNFHRPVSVSWRSKDYYLGVTHAKGLNELMKYFRFTPSDLSNNTLQEEIEDRIRLLSQKLAMIDKKDESYPQIHGEFINSRFWLFSVQNMFSVTPSVLDLLVNYDPENIRDSWQNSLENANIRHNNHLCTIESDILYPNILMPAIKTDTIPVLYKSIEGLRIEKAGARF